MFASLTTILPLLYWYKFRSPSGESALIASAAAFVIMIAARIKQYTGRRLRATAALYSQPVGVLAAFTFDAITIILPGTLPTWQIG